MFTAEHAWMTAAIGSITIFWGYLQGVCSRLSSFVIVTADVEGGQAVEALMGYLWKNYSRTPFVPRRFTSDKDYIRPLGRYGIVGYETTSKALTFFKGWRPIFISGMESKDGRYNGNVKISFLRGTFNLDEIIINAIETLDQYRHTKSSKGSRYQVRKRFGNKGNSDLPDSKRLKDSADGDSDEKMEASDRIGSIPLKWTLNELGAPTSASPFESLSYPPHIHDFVTEIERWKNSQEWHKAKGLNWRFGAGLFGPPGTGKTSLVRAIAQKLDMPVHVYDLTTMSNEELAKTWRGSLNSSPCIVLFEDIDRLFDQDRNIKQSIHGQPLTLDALLNCISGVEPAEGILVLVTANNIDKLDPALGVPDGDGKSTRPGRLDRAVFFSALTREARLSIATRILEDCLHLLHKVVDEGEGETGAQFENRCGKIALAEFWGKPKTYTEGPTQSM